VEEKGGDVVTAVAEVELVARAVDRDRSVFVDLPPEWVVNVGPPAVAGPVDWGGVAPAVAVGFEADSLRGDMLAAGVVAAALGRLGDPVVVEVRLVGDGVEVVVGHRLWGVDVTTFERHHRLAASERWVVACTVADAELGDWARVARRIVGSLAVRS
jgi:hypothetical protein